MAETKIFPTLDETLKFLNKVCNPRKKRNFVIYWHQIIRNREINWEVQMMPISEYLEKNSHGVP